MDSRSFASSSATASARRCTRSQVPNYGQPAGPRLTRHGAGD
jgi:hypothetical protein